MMKHLLIGASALVLTATAAQAQVVPGATPDSVTELSVNKTLTVPVSSNATLRSNLNSRTQTTATTADAVINAVTGAAVPSTSATGNKSGVDQDGDNNDALVDQQGGYRGWAAVKQDGDNNEAEVDQNDGRTSGAGSFNAAYVQQVGENQAATVNQTRNATGNRNNAVVQQGGFTRTVNIPFVGAVSYVVPSSNNEARIDQTGAGNNASIAQGVGALVTGSDSYAFIEQVNGSTNNQASIQQRYASNGAIFQTGATESKAMIVQNLSLYGALDSDIVQSGDGNYAANYQDVEFGGADSYINQDGDGNEAFVNQSGNAAGQRVSELFQDGDDNLAQVLQTVAPTSTSLLSQSGNNNVAIVRQ